ncbi:TPA: sugar ABC transporter substrate-binding protein [Candidatus Poribacteria bacterium]|nr:sugar ABC transporter substrate-binding protein [Candidatus Poribacteria bacterium]
MKVKLLITLFISALILFPGCSERKKGIRIGVCVADGRKAAYTEIRRGMVEEAKRLKVDLIWKDVSRRKKNESTVAAERRFIYEMFGEGIDALVWNPVTPDPKFDYVIIRKARQRKVPIVSLDGYPRRLRVSLLVEPNYVEMGRMAAKAAVERTLRYRERANFIVIEEPPKDENLRKVTLGIYDVLDGYQGVNLLAGIHVESPFRALGLINALLTRYADNVQAIISCNTDVMPGVMEALRAHGLLDKTVTVSVGAGRKTIRYLLAGEHDIEIDPMHRERGKLALKMALKLVKGERIDPDDMIDNLGVKLPVKYGPARALDRRRAYLLREVYPDLWR